MTRSVIQRHRHFPFSIVASLACSACIKYVALYSTCSCISTSDVGKDQTKKTFMHRNKTNAAHCNSQPQCMLVFLLIFVNCNYLEQSCQTCKERPSDFSYRYRRCRFRLQGPEGGFPQWEPPKKSKGRASVQPLTVTRNRWLGTAGNVPASTRKFQQMSMSRRILPPQEPQRSTTSLHNSPQTRAAFSSKHRAISVLTPLTSLLLASSIHPPLATVSSKPLRRRCTRQLF